MITQRRLPRHSLLERYSYLDLSPTSPRISSSRVALINLSRGSHPNSRYSVVSVRVFLALLNRRIFASIYMVASTALVAILHPELKRGGSTSLITNREPTLPSRSDQRTLSTC